MTLSPGACVSSTRSSGCWASMVWPSMAVMMSPSLRPALAAGPSLTMGSAWCRLPRRRVDPGAGLDVQLVVLGHLRVEGQVVDADPGAGDVLAREDLGDDGLGEIDGDGEADALRGAGLGRVDADDLAVAIEQRTTGVAGVDGSVGLDEVDQAVRRSGRSGRDTTTVRSRPLTMPEVTEPGNWPSGSPMAMASWPSWSAEESPSWAVGSPVASILTNARSV